jgi:hypothetical protein
MEEEREFRELDIPEMESLLDQYDWNEELAGRLLVELATRRDNSPAARQLRARLMRLPGVRRLDDALPRGTAEGFPQQATATVKRARLNLLAGEVATIRPVGTPNLPVPKVKALDRDFVLPVAPDAPRCTQYRVVIEEYIKEIQDSGRGTKREVRNGHRTSAPGSPHLYTFEISRTGDIPENTELPLLVKDSSVMSAVFNKTPTTISLKLESDIGTEVSKAQLRIDDTELLKKLRDRIEAIESHQFEFNSALADAVVGAGTAPRIEPIPEQRSAAATLNSSQLKALRHVLNHAVTFIWGPPGCGKTKTLGEVVRSTFDSGHRTLICSNTNKAVDQVLYSICTALGKDNSAVQSGSIVRLGDLADPKLAREFGDCIEIDSIVKRLMGTLQLRINQLKTRIADVQREAGALAGLLARFGQLEAAQRRLSELNGRLSALEKDATQLTQQLSANKLRMTELADELRRAGRWRLLPGRGVSLITADRDSSERERGGPARCSAAREHRQP